MSKYLPFFSRTFIFPFVAAKSAPIYKGMGKRIYLLAATACYFRNKKSLRETKDGNREER